LQIVARSRKTQNCAPPFDEGLIAQSLDRIAAILIRAGLDLPGAERLLRQAFIVAAAKAARATNAKVTQSQIASIAGVSRLEVRKCLANNAHIKAGKHPKPNSRIETVISGWRNDPEFSNKRRQPRDLSFSGATSEFETLVRKYGRDVTSKTIRVRLISLGLARVDAGKLHLISEPGKVSRSHAAIADLRYIASQLSNIDFELGRRAYLTRHISIAGDDRKSVLAMRRIATTRLDTVLSSLLSMSAEKTSNRSRHRKPTHRLIVSSTIALENEARK
jgi:hypothetical protein